LLYWSNHPTLQIWPLVTSFFPKLKEVIKGTRFQDSEAIETAVTRELPGVRGRRDWKSASEPKKITLKVTCCKICLSNKIKHL